ncbi:MAG: pyruvate, water dikinase regulatory protein [Pseudomonadota bacterium]
MAKRLIYLISDHTGITVETMGRALLSQFEQLEYELVRWPFIDSMEKARGAADRIRRTGRDSALPPIVFSTLVDPAIRACFKGIGALVFDFFESFTSRLEEELEHKSTPIHGQRHGLVNRRAYDERIQAVNFALANDDGATTKNYPAADLILIGVSRCGKTPSCLFLGLQQGILAANYPLTEEDLLQDRLPAPLQGFREKLIGLTIDAQQLHRIRQERRPNSRYASLEQCRREVRLVESLFRDQQIPFLNTTAMSIEEIATRLLQRLKPQS